jgi:hypothetical protein
VPVSEVDGRTIGDAGGRPVVHRLRALYQAAVERDVAESARARRSP